MSSSQIKIELQSYLDLLVREQKDVISAHEKFQIALASTLKLIGEASSTLAHLQGTSNDLKSYLIQLNSSLFETTKNSFKHLKEGIEPVVELVQSFNRKS